MIVDLYESDLYKDLRGSSKFLDKLKESKTSDAEYFISIFKCFEPNIKVKDSYYSTRDCDRDSEHIVTVDIVYDKPFSLSELKYYLYPELPRYNFYCEESRGLYGFNSMRYEFRKKRDSDMDFHN